MTKGTEQKLGSLADQAINNLGKFFNRKERTSQDIGVARVATSVLSAWTRQQQTKSAERTTMFMLARELATDRDQLAEYVRLTMPDASIVKLLPQPK